VRFAIMGSPFGYAWKNGGTKQGLSKNRVNQWQLMAISGNQWQGMARNGKE